MIIWYQDYYINYSCLTLNHLCIWHLFALWIIPLRGIIGSFLLQVLKESFKIYCAINDGIINLVDKVNWIFTYITYFKALVQTSHTEFQVFLWQFFEMPRHEAVKALEIYRRAGQQVMIIDNYSFLNVIVFKQYFL